jgi:hypothetical protein
MFVKREVMTGVYSRRAAAILETEEEEEEKKGREERREEKKKEVVSRIYVFGPRFTVHRLFGPIPTFLLPFHRTLFPIPLLPPLFRPLFHLNFLLIFFPLSDFHEPQRFVGWAIIDHPGKRWET